MKFSKLRLLGFKSFVEPTEFHIENGLTGIVGPNGCGKSNLVEALRWVMGENSYKNMRGSGMDDVIFSGSGNRPSRNTAEVALFLDNDDRTAPAAFNDSEELQVSRRIERESGSVYRINGKDVRAKDVQLLFADASTGARSPSMVGQGRIGELISAKPQARRALLEEAAGISGLHSRRHEAELRLRAAESNLERLEDVIGQMDSQLDSLKRQARQANRYRNLSGEVRKTEALLMHLRWVGAKDAHGSAQSALSEASSAVAVSAEKQAIAAKEQAIIASKLPGFRDEQAKAAAALQRLTIAKSQIEEEIERANSRKGELESRIRQLDEDIGREERMVAENEAFLARLSEEEADLKEKSQRVVDTEATTKASLEEATTTLDSSERKLAEITAEHAEKNAAKVQFVRSLTDASDREARLEAQLEKVSADLDFLLKEISELAEPAQKKDAVDALELRQSEFEQAVENARALVDAARENEQTIRPSVSEANAALKEIEAEARTIRNLLNQGAQELFPAIVEQIKVESGYEAALGAALGSDLEAPTDPAAPAHWQILTGDGDSPLPGGATSLASFVKAPEELRRRLSQIGVVDQSKGKNLCDQLKPGQRLVSKEGDLWRWDGFQAGAEAPTAAAQKLAHKNRLMELEAAATDAITHLRTFEGELDKAKLATATAEQDEQQKRLQIRDLQQDLDKARGELLTAERAISQFTSRKSTLEDTKVRLLADLEETKSKKREFEVSLASVDDIEALAANLNELRAVVANDRAKLAESRAAADGLSREAEARGRRLEAIIGERENWKRRVSNAQKQINTIRGRRSQTETELEQVLSAPEAIAQRRSQLLNELEIAETNRSEAADRLAIAENQLAEADRLCATTLQALSEAREVRARGEERVSATKERLGEIETRIRDELNTQPADVLGIVEVNPDAPLPEIMATENRLEKLKADRERLGAVNLRADTEQEEIQEQRDALVAERDDLIEAIRKLRLGISSLNKEGRERLLEAFDMVNDQFQRLFTHLFGGGTAELQLIESDDPLEAGLEILARPPGKKPQTMTLLSGGEQALTAMALIFAVFLTNPAPICVLDEVDAPLDDHNVERFCNLMDEMSTSTDTRFVIITHNPITMARMNRLFGVTMAERGVSQLVSVDLQQAEELVEAS